MLISFVILTWNSERHIENCLAAILAHVEGDFSPYEIFVVDNGSNDKTREIIDHFRGVYPEIVKPIYLKTNTGTTYSRNMALKQASGDYVVVLDSDVVVCPSFLEVLVGAINDSPDIGMVVPKMIYADGRFQKSTDSFPTLTSKLWRYFFLKKMEETGGQECLSGQNIEVDYAISAFWLLKKDVVARVGLLDENIFYAPEDVDYCLRVWKAGFKIVYVAGCEIVHDAQEISRGFRVNKALWEHIKGLAYYFLKHKYCFVRPKFHSCP
ncbi:MAG: glycosyltransferase family 2 protein [Thermodesulfobacteriota bacterium]